MATRNANRNMGRSGCLIREAKKEGEGTWSAGRTMSEVVPKARGKTGEQGKRKGLRAENGENDPNGIGIFWKG